MGLGTGSKINDWGEAIKEAASMYVYQPSVMNSSDNLAYKIC